MQIISSHPAKFYIIPRFSIGVSVIGSIYQISISNDLKIGFSINANIVI